MSLTDIREWRNSFVQINRIPLDVLSLIPSHLHFAQDRLKATHVCRHWRRTFLRHATLWSQLFLSRGEACISTFLKRAKGSTLQVFAIHDRSGEMMALLSPYIQQIGSLHFMFRPWTEIQRFSDDNSGPLPFLRTLEININDTWTSGHSPPLFRGAVNVERFVFRSEKPSFLNHFVFPNLTTLELSANPASAGLRASDVLDFLQASPMLRTVCMTITGTILPERVARSRVVVLPNVQTFSLDMDDGLRAYELVAHISCPSASRTLLTHRRRVDDIHTNNDLQDMFPTATSWDAIVGQFTRGPMEAVTLKIKTPRYPVIACTLTFQSPDAAFMKLDIKVSGDLERRDQFHIPLEDMSLGVFSRASAIIQCHPLLRGTRCLRILDRTPSENADWMESVAGETRALIDSIGLVEELTLHGCGLRSCLNRYIIDTANSGSLPLELKELTISQPFYTEGEEEGCLAVVVELAKLQHMRGTPILRVTVYLERLPAALVGVLEQWVGTVDYRGGHYIG